MTLSYDSYIVNIFYECTIIDEIPSITILFSSPALYSLQKISEATQCQLILYISSISSIAYSSHYLFFKPLLTMLIFPELVFYIQPIYPCSEFTVTVEMYSEDMLMLLVDASSNIELYLLKSDDTTKIYELNMVNGVATFYDITVNTQGNFYIMAKYSLLDYVNVTSDLIMYNSLHLELLNTV